MKIKIMFILIFLSSLFASSKPTIILLHGFMGWGRDEMGDYYYWGGATDLQEYLISEGFNVHSVSVGPISSNWDRAIEAFYQIKGGQLDYGSSHSIEYDIIQKPEGKYYEGFFQDWNQNSPIHIINHSQGGQTARMLERLLKQSFNGESSPLLSNKRLGWIKSITTISTPHNGTTLVPIMTKKLPFIHDLAPLLGGIDIEDINNLYNFDLEHWDLERQPGESLKFYYKRIGNSPLSQKKNLSAWDLSLEGAEELVA